LSTYTKRANLCVLAAALAAAALALSCRGSTVVAGAALHSPGQRGLTSLGRCQHGRPTTRVLRAQRAKPEEEGVDNGQFTSG
ncbi:hypothetical protein TYRP_003715, partial [Tyrophagus putrescentiae]